MLDLANEADPGRPTDDSASAEGGLDSAQDLCGEQHPSLGIASVEKEKDSEELAGA